MYAKQDKRQKQAKCRYGTAQSRRNRLNNKKDCIDNRFACADNRYYWPITAILRYQTAILDPLS